MVFNVTKHNEILGHWYFYDQVKHKGQLPTPTVGLFFMKNLMNIAAGDGTLSDRERQWVVGFATACGNPKEVIDELRTYQPSSTAEAFEVLQGHMNQNYVKMTRRSMIYNAIRAAGADGKLQEDEIKAVYAFAKYLDVTEEQVREVQDLYEEEQKMREKRAAILFPNGFGAVLKAFEELK